MQYIFGNTCKVPIFYQLRAIKLKGILLPFFFGYVQLTDFSYVYTDMYIQRVNLSNKQFLDKFIICTGKSCYDSYSGCNLLHLCSLPVLALLLVNCPLSQTELYKYSLTFFFWLNKTNINQIQLFFQLHSIHCFTIAVIFSFILNVHNHQIIDDTLIIHSVMFSSAFLWNILYLLGYLFTYSSPGIRDIITTWSQKTLEHLKISSYGWTTLIKFSQQIDFFGRTS